MHPPPTKVIFSVSNPVPSCVLATLCGKNTDKIMFLYLEALREDVLKKKKKKTSSKRFLKKLRVNSETQWQLSSSSGANHTSPRL